MELTSREVLAASVVALVVLCLGLQSVVVAAVPLLERPGVSQEAALILLEQDADLHAVTDAVEHAGGRVVHVFPPSALIAQLSNDVARPAGVRAVHHRTIDQASIMSLGKDGRRAAELWNRLLTAPSSADEILEVASLPDELVGDALVPPAPSSNLQPTATDGEPIPDATQTSEYMIGRVAVGIVLPESDGGVDGSTEDWTEDERALVLSEITAALDWWAKMEPRANLTFVYDDGTAAPINTSYEPIRRPYLEQSLWIEDVMARMGYSGLSYFDQVRRYNHDLRNTYETDWAFTIFVVDSSSDGDNRFADGSFAYAYLGGPFAVLTSGSNGYGAQNLDAVVAHEIGHIFLALDQYETAHQPCTRRSGYLGAENQNSRYGDCASDQPSIMRGQVWPFHNGSLDQYARGQIGWRDTDGDGILDPIDTAVELTSADYVTDGTRSNVFIFSGRVRDKPYPSPLRESVTINTIEAVAYRVAGDDWVDAQPSDGAFDSAAEDFTFATRPLPTGNIEIELRAINSTGNVLTETLATVAAVDPLDEVLETILVRVGPQAMDQSQSKLTYRGRGTSPATTFVAGIYYRVDDGDWELIGADDGLFDEPEEDFTLTLPLGPLSPGVHRLEVYAEDSEGNVDTSPASDEFTVTAAPRRQFLPLVALSP